MSRRWESRDGRNAPSGAQRRDGSSGFSTGRRPNLLRPRRMEDGRRLGLGEAVPRSEAGREMPRAMVRGKGPEHSPW